MAHKLTAHMIYYIIPAIKEHITISSVISAVKMTSSFTLDALYCLMCIVEERIGVSLCVFIFVSLCVFIFVSLCVFIFVSLCVFMFVSLCVFIFVSLCVFIFVSLCVFIFVCVHVSV